MDYVLNLAPYGSANPVTAAPPWSATLGSAAARVNGGTIFYPASGPQTGWTYGNSALGVDGSNDSIVTITVGGADFTSYSALITMLKSDGSGYILRVNPFSVELIRAPVGGLNTTFAVLNTFSTAVANTDVYILKYNRITGLLSGFKNGTSIITTTDTTYLSDDLYGGFAARGYNNYIGVTAATIYNLVVREVTSINSGNPITAGQIGIPVVASGFTAKPTGVTATYASGAKSITATVDSGGTATNFNISIQDRIEAEDWPINGDTLTFTFTYGSESASGTQTLVKKADEVVLTVSGGITSDPATWTYWLNDDGFTVEGGEHVYDPYGDLVLTADGGGSATNAGTFTSWFRPATGTGAGNVYAYTWVITEAGISLLTGASNSHYVGLGLGIGF